MILRAWKRFRPINAGSNQGRRAEPRTREKNIVDIFGEKFTTELMSKIRLRMYNYEETQEQKDIKKEYKERFRLKYEEKLQNILNEENKYNGPATIDQEPEERE